MDDVIADSDDINDLLGIVVFGNIAQEGTDRRSDIDLIVVVDSDYD